MQLVEIDIVGLEPLQRRVDRIKDVLARHPLIPWLSAHLSDAFGGEDEARALALQPAADDLLGSTCRLTAAAERIDVRGVEEIDAALGSFVEDGSASLLVALKPEGHRAEAEPGHAKAGPAEFRVVHEIRLAPSRQDA